MLQTFLDLMTSSIQQLHFAETLLADALCVASTHVAAVTTVPGLFAQLTGTSSNCASVMIASIIKSILFASYVCTIFNSFTRVFVTVNDVFLISLKENYDVEFLVHNNHLLLQFL